MSDKVDWRDLADARASLASSEASYKRKVVELDASLADALRKKNRERVARDNELKQVTMNMQRETENKRALKEITLFNDGF